MQNTGFYIYQGATMSTVNMLYTIYFKVAYFQVQICENTQKIKKLGRDTDAKT